MNGWWDRTPAWTKIVLIVGAFVVFAVIAGKEDDKGTKAAKEPSLRLADDNSGPVTDAEAVRIVEENFDDATPNTDASCYPRAGTCDITYYMGDILGLFDTSRELVDKQRDVWAALFDHPRFKKGTITLRGEVVTVGGKEKVADTLKVTCDRWAAKQINWNNVDADGLKTLCSWTELVSFD